MILAIAAVGVHLRAPCRCRDVRPGDGTNHAAIAEGCACCVEHGSERSPGDEPRDDDECPSEPGGHHKCPCAMMCCAPGAPAMPPTWDGGVAQWLHPVLSRTGIALLGEVRAAFAGAVLRPPRF